MIEKVVKEIDNARVMSRDAEIVKKYRGTLSSAVRFIERNQICEVGLWKKFVDVFRIQKDATYPAPMTPWSSWRSEYWGKMMRGACMVLAYTRDEDMYKIVEDSVKDILTTQEESGRISGYPTESEFERWDIWGRKYVMLGLMYFLEISRDEELNGRIIEAMKKHADYMLDRIGPGKLDIRDCSKNWEGLNSCSVLEPMVRLYRLTGEKRYLDFSEYIISTGFIKSANLIDLAYAGVPPYEYPVVKAYEMMSCFEGLLQYYYLTGIEKYKTALLNFGHRIVENELSIIGCSGCTHELFDHTAVRQTQTDYEGIVQETCVTVTWMKLAAALLELSGESVFADCIEQSFYNNYLGSMNEQRVPDNPIEQCPPTNVVPQVLPFDSYSPLVSDIRGRKVGGFNFFEDRTFYGCCACIGAAGAGVIPEIALMRTESGFVMNYYENGEIYAKTPSGAEAVMTVSTAYPYRGKVKVALELSENENFTLSFRIPGWCRGAKISVGGRSSYAVPGYATVNKEWQNGDIIELDMPMVVERILPPEGAVNEDIFAGYRIGPVVLAADRRVSDPDGIFDVVCDEDGMVAATPDACLEIPERKICYRLPLSDGGEVRLIDYASAGKTWTEESRCAAWLRSK